MTDKYTKSDSWTIKELMNKITNNDISKPKYQRQKKWTDKPKSTNSANINSKPNYKEFIEFLFRTGNIVQIITLGAKQTPNGMKYEIIDGNNRINAMKNFMEKPFRILSDLPELEKLVEKIKSINIIEEEHKELIDINITDEHKEKLIDIIINLSYDEIMNFKYHKYFINNNYEELYKTIKFFRDEFDDPIEEIQQRLRYNGERLDLVKLLNVVIFSNYTTDELCTTFKSINQYNNTMTEMELLASSLHGNHNFEIRDKSLEANLKKSIEEYYNNKKQGEALTCYEFDYSEEMNAFDLLVSIQIYLNKKYSFIGKVKYRNLNQSLLLVFKLWKILNDWNFTTESIEKFIDELNYSCEILEETKNNIFTNIINEKLFNKSCKNNKLDTLKDNNLFIIFTSIIGFKREHKAKKEIINKIEICLLYHYFVKDLKDEGKILKDKYAVSDSIYHKAGGAYIENLCKNLLTKPEEISKITKKDFSDLLKDLISEGNKPISIDSKPKRRRKLKFFEKILMCVFYKLEVSQNLLKEKFSLEHISPFSSSWDSELDIDRFGNLIPILDKMNCSRGCRHINVYSSEPLKKFLQKILPDSDTYDSIVEYGNKEKSKKPKIINNEKYEILCEQNETVYMEIFIDYLFEKS